jgi:hypothetical protein
MLGHTQTRNFTRDLLLSDGHSPKTHMQQSRDLPLAVASPPFSGVYGAELIHDVRVGRGGARGYRGWRGGSGGGDCRQFTSKHRGGGSSGGGSGGGGS